MIELQLKTKKWGNSVGLIIPKKYSIRPHQEVKVHIEPIKKFTTVKDIFGTFKSKRSTKQIMREIDKELDM